MASRIDFTKLALLLTAAAAAAVAARGHLSGLPAPPAGGVVTIPAQSPENRQAAAPLAAVRTQNPAAAAALADLLAALAWLVQQGPQETYTAGEVARLIERAGESLLALRDETGSLPGYSAAVNKTLDNLWGADDRQLSRQAAAGGIYAAAAALK